MVVAVDAVRREPLRQRRSSSACGRRPSRPPIACAPTRAPPWSSPWTRSGARLRQVPVIGRLVARRAGPVAARTSGPVAEFRVDVGDRVRSGDVISVLVKDSLQWQRELLDAEASHYAAAVRTMDAELALLAQELERLRKLRTSAAFSQARLEDKLQEVARAESEKIEAQAELRRARANLKLAEINLYNADVRAPFAGVVIRRHTEVGSYVKVGDPLITLLDDRTMEIEADVPAERVRGLEPGTEVRYRLAAGRDLRAAVRAVVPDENPLTRTRIVRFTPRSGFHDDGIAANQSVTLHLPLGTPREVLTVHKDAVLERKGKSMVYVVNGETAAPRPVTLGEGVGNRFEVIDGLEQGELVVVRGNERLIPGQKVDPREGS